ncbi:MAG TPA: substrate-binding domain-containing protein [Treponemataceae bacterium]|nr:substrate-binding domain-containing protein [Treponemataceae bacterium]
MTIGFFVDSLTGTSGYQEPIWQGVTDAARDAGARVITFVGGAIGFSSLNPFERMKNVAYDLAPEDIDGIVLCGGSIGNAITPEAFDGFCARFSGKPLVSVGPAGSRVPRVIVDNDSGMREIILHLIRDHGYRNLAFITGPKGNLEADRRKEIFLAVLRESGITPDPRLIYEGDFNVPSGSDAVRHWYGKLSLRPEAIVASNDGMAFGALGALRELGLAVPSDVAITGFDDLKLAAVSMPPLSTVGQPLYEQGRQAVDLILRKIRGETIPFESCVRPTFVRRQSCGCLAASVSAYGETGALSANEAERLALSRIPDASVSVKGRVSAIAAELSRDGADPDALLSSFADLFNEGFDGTGNGERWNAVLGDLSRIASANPASPAILRRAQAALAERERQLLFLKRADQARDAERLASVVRDILTSSSLENIQASMAKGLQSIGISSAFLCRFDDSEKPLGGARVIAAVRDGKAVDFPGESFSPRSVLPESMRALSSDKGALIVQPLYYREHLLGYAVFGQATKSGTAYESITVELSAALQGATLIERTLLAEREIEERSRKIELLVRPMIDSIADISKTVAERREEVERLGALGRQSLEDMGEMERRTKSLAGMLEKAGALVSDVEGIAEVINVVAINASIEAAHVGKAGAGFSVIAGEVRKLAATTQKNSEEIAGFLSSIGSGVTGIAGSNTELSASFGTLSRNVQDTVHLLEVIAERTSNLSQGSAEILSVMSR